METLTDLTTLCEFLGTTVQEAPQDGLCLGLFGPMLTHPNKVTFPWPPLRQALEDFFEPGAGDDEAATIELDPAKIGGGWAGLSLVLTAFKRLEVVESEEETKEVLAWLSALKLATVRQSVIHEEPYSNTLQDILANLLEAVPPEELIPHSQSLSASPEQVNGHGTRGKMAAANKKRKVTNPRTKESVAVASTSSMPSFADLPDLHDLDGFEDFSEEDSSRSGRRGAYAKASAKVQSLAKQLSDATGMHLNKCAETISRMPKEDINSIGANGSLPDSLLLSAFDAPKTEDPRPTAPKPKKPTTTPRPSVGGEAAEGSGPVVKKVTRIQRPHDPNRPQFSYSALIGQAILNHPEKKMRLGEIYDYVTSHYSYYKKNECGWQNSIRHNLSLQPVFRKIPDLSIPGKKGCFWLIIESEEWRFANGGWKKIEKGELVPSRDGGPPILVGPGVQVKMSAKKLAAQKRAAEEAALAEADEGSGGDDSMAIGDGDESANEGDVFSDDE